MKKICIKPVEKKQGHMLFILTLLKGPVLEMTRFWR